MMRKAATPSAPVPVYSLENHATTRGERILTSIFPMTNDFDMTILFDMDLTNVTSGNASKYRLIFINSSTSGTYSFSVGKGAATDTALATWFFQNNGVTRSSISSSSGRHIIAVRHSAASNKLYLSYKSGNNARVDLTLSGTFFASPDKPIGFGGGSNNAYSLPAGTIHSARIYDQILTDAQVDDFFAGTF